MANEPIDCKRCKGTGKIRRDECNTCKGSGKVILTMSKANVGVHTVVTPVKQ